MSWLKSAVAPFRWRCCRRANCPNSSESAGGIVRPDAVGFERSRGRRSGNAPKQGWGHREEGFGRRNVRTADGPTGMTEAEAEIARRPCRAGQNSRERLISVPLILRTNLQQPAHRKLTLDFAEKAARAVSPPPYCPIRAIISGIARNARKFAVPALPRFATRSSSRRAARGSESRTPQFEGDTGAAIFPAGDLTAQRVDSIQSRGPPKLWPRCARQIPVARRTSRSAETRIRWGNRSLAWANKKRPSPPI